jgi:hypothetical protein
MDNALRVTFSALLLLVIFFVVHNQSQAQAAPPPISSSQSQPAAQPHGVPQGPPPADPADKPRVFITDSQSWEMVGHAGGANGAFAAESHGGARPQTAEIIKTFAQRCPGAVTNNQQAKANYIVVLDHEGGKGYLRHRNKVAVFDAQSGDSVISKSTLSLGGSVEDACKGIMQHWATRRSAPQNDPPAQAQVQPVAATIDAKAVGAKLSITSLPDGADIEIDGAFMGNTPSALQLAPGDHTISIKKSGYKAWERKMKIAGGEVNIRAELEKSE